MVECCSQYFGQVEHAEVQQKIMQNGTLDSHLRTQCIETEYGREAQRAKSERYELLTARSKNTILKIRIDPIISIRKQQTMPSDCRPQ